MHLDQWTKELVAGLAEAGVHAASDKRNLAVPGVLVSPASIDPLTLGGDVWTVEWDVVLIASDSGTDSAVRQLTRLAEKLDEVHRLGRLEAVAIRLPNHSPDGLPALRTTITTECED